MIRSVGRSGWIVGAGIARLLTKRKPGRGESGASLVETAMVIAVFAPLLMLGTFEISALVYASIEVSDAARAAASYAAEYYIANSGSSLPSQSQVTAAAQNDAPELLEMLKSGTQFTATMATGCGTGTATTGNTVPSCASGTMPYVQVSTQATVSPLVQYFGFLNSPTVSGQAKIDLVN
jgi:Flp pilus assembly protein TadG